MEEKMDYLIENTQGIINKYIHDLINEYYKLQHDLEDIKEEYENYKEHSRPLTAYEETGLTPKDFM